MLYLDAPGWLCVLRILLRTAARYGRVRPDAAPGCHERLDPAFLRFAWRWNRRSRGKVLGLLPEGSVVVKNRKQALLF